MVHAWLHMQESELTRFTNKEIILVGCTLLQILLGVCTSLYVARLKQRESFGRELGSASGKQTAVRETNQLVYKTRTLYVTELTNIAQGEGIDQRDRRTIELMGVKLCMELTALSNNPLYVNVAVVHLKNTDSGLNTDFFRGASGSRGVDFDISLNSNEFHCLPLNTDKFVVLSHKRHCLNGGVPKFPGPDIETISLAGYNYVNTATNIQEAAPTQLPPTVT
jgi:hypothetical protein